MLQPENLLLIDIETVPLQKNYSDLHENLQRLWDKKSQLIANDITDSHSTFSERAGIYAEFGKIICIGLGYFVKNKIASDTGNLYSLKIKSIFGNNKKEIKK